MIVQYSHVVDNSLYKWKHRLSSLLFFPLQAYLSNPSSSWRHRFHTFSFHLAAILDFHTAIVLDEVVGVRRRFLCSFTFPVNCPLETQVIYRRVSDFERWSDQKRDSIDATNKQLRAQPKRRVSFYLLSPQDLSDSRCTFSLLCLDRFVSGL